VFRGGVTLVNVDVYPRRNGRTIEGLRKEDFQILEDGKPQAIEAFEFIRIEPNAPDAERRDPNTKEEGEAQAADPHNRVFIIYLDLNHTAFFNALQARQPLLNFLDRVIGPKDLFGVLTPETPIRQLVLGRRTGTLQAEMTQSYFDWGLSDSGNLTPRTPFEEQLYAFCIDGETLIKLHREDELMSSLEQLMIYLGALRDERKDLLLISEGWIPRPAKPVQMSGGGSAPPPPPIGVTPGTGRLGVDVPTVGSSNTSWCNQQASRLTNIDFEQRFRNLLTLAQRANVSFYPVDAGGLKTFAPTASMGTRNGLPNPTIMRAAGEAKIEVLRTLADNTDGRAIVNTNDISGGFKQIADDVSSYYLLGYSSTNQTLDGKFRKIEVKVDQPRVSVSARKGYFAAVAAPVPTTSAPTTSSVPPGITDELGRLSRLRSDAEVFGYVAARSDSLEVVAELATAEIERGGWNSGADVRVEATGPNDQAISATGRIEAGARGTLIRVPVAANDGPWRLGLRVSNTARTIEDRADAPVRVARSLLGEPICYRGTASPRIPLRPVADFQFRRSERLHVEWPVLKPLDQHTARLLDRRGQPLAVNVPVTKNAEVLSTDLALAPLAEGDYLIELTAGSAAQTERDLLAFRVVR